MDRPVVIADAEDLRDSARVRAIPPQTATHLLPAGCPGRETWRPRQPRRRCPWSPLAARPRRPPPSALSSDWLSRQPPRIRARRIVGHRVPEAETSMDRQGPLLG